MGEVFRDFLHKLRRGSDYDLPFTVWEPTGKLALTGVPTGGTFTLRFRGYTTVAIAYNATAATVAAALADLPNIASGNVTCTGGPLPGAVTITFAGVLAGDRPSEIVADGAGLTGGTSPDAEVTPTPDNITSWTALALYAKASLGTADGSAEITKTLGSGITLVDGATGQGKVTLAPADYPAQTEDLLRLWVRLQGKDENGKLHIVATGLWMIERM